MTPTRKKKVVADFKTRFGEPECLVRAPGRANIIGEHVDYCEGLVLPFAIKQSMYFCGKRRNDSLVYLHAFDYSKTIQLESEKEAPNWSKYFLQIINLLGKKKGLNQGFDLSFGSDIPIGGGVSSSSALCCGFLLLLNELLGLRLSKRQILNLASEAEHGIGLRGGKMDQTAIMFGKKDKAIFLDCKNETHQFIDLSLEENKFVLFDTGVKHSLVDSEYNKRREEVDLALKCVCKSIGKEVSFRELTLTDIAFLEKESTVLFNRISHVISEIDRVKQSVKAIDAKEYSSLGLLMNDSHRSLKERLEVSCNELDFIAEHLQRQANVYGARMMGGGFGGNVIALVKSGYSGGFNKLTSDYEERFGIKLKIIEVEPGKGASIEKI
ncbi:MAG: galactokinase [Saprospiraceae bacterium]|nr:galactokinase [Saprospiraceae bacterium]